MAFLKTIYFHVSGVVVRVRRDQLSLLSAAVAFYALLALFPAMLGLVSAYGILADPGDVEALLERTRLVLPSSANDLLASQLHDIIAQAPTGLGISFFVALILALWTTSTGIVALLRAVRFAHRLPPMSAVDIRARAMLMAMGTLIFGIVLLMLLVVVPVTMRTIFPDSVSTAASALIEALRWPLLLVVFAGGVLVVYRVAGAGEDTMRHAWPGVLASTMIWIASSWGFTVYVEGFANYSKTYGTLGAVVVLQMWFFLTAFATVLGAELNAAIRDHALGRPIDHNVLETRDLDSIIPPTPPVAEVPPDAT